MLSWSLRTGGSGERREKLYTEVKQRHFQAEKSVRK